MGCILSVNAVTYSSIHSSTYTYTLPTASMPSSAPFAPFGDFGWLAVPLWLRAKPFTTTSLCDIYDEWWLRTNLRISSCTHTQGTCARCLAVEMLHGIVWSPAGYFIEGMTPNYSMNVSIHKIPRVSVKCLVCVIALTARRSCSTVYLHERMLTLGRIEFDALQTYTPPFSSPFDAGNPLRQPSRQSKPSLRIRETAYHHPFGPLDRRLQAPAPPPLANPTYPPSPSPTLTERRYPGQPLSSPRLKVLFSYPLSFPRSSTCTAHHRKNTAKGGSRPVGKSDSPTALACCLGAAMTTLARVAWSSLCPQMASQRLVWGQRWTGQLPLELALRREPPWPPLDTNY